MKIENFKINQWMNKETGEVMYGIDVKVGRVWCHLKEGEDRLIYADKREANEKLKALKSTLKPAK
jgi:hypothetical protein